MEQACVLVNNATETVWFQNMLKTATTVCFVMGRIKFLDADGKASGAPLQGQAVLYFGKQTQRFNEEFSNFGVILQHAR